MKRVWFTFKILEVILSLCCLGYHTRGFLNINYIQDHYTYVAVFGGFSLISMFGCLSICMKATVHPLREAVLNLIAAIAFISVSMNSMYHAEKDFYLMYLSAGIEDDIEEEQHVVEDLIEQPRPFFKYSKAQSVAALCCGSIYLLHAILAFDVAMLRNDTTVADSVVDDASGGESNNDQRLKLYVFGKRVHNWLDKFKWFSSIADVPKQISENVVAETVM